MSYHPTNEVTTVIGMPLPFKNGEYKNRIDALRSQMTKEKIDFLLLFHQESMYYLFGYDQLGYWVYQTAVIDVNKEDITVLCRPADHNFIEGLPYVKEVRNWIDDSNKSPVELTIEMLFDLKALKPKKRIGIELGSHALLPKYYVGLEKSLKDQCSLVDASRIVTNLRQIKTESEVVYMKEAGKVLDSAYNAALNVFKPGVLETEVLGAAMSGMFEAGGHVPAIVPPISSGPRSMSNTHGAAVDRVIKLGEHITIEPGSSRFRYHAVGVQTWWLGEPPKEVERVFDGLLTAQKEALSIIKAGIASADVARKINQTLIEKDLHIPGAHHGYGIGIGYPPTWLDDLRIKETDYHILEKNMTFFLVSRFPVFNLADYPIQIYVGEPILVTDEGCERLSSTQISLN